MFVSVRLRQGQTPPLTLSWSKRTGWRSTADIVSETNVGEWGDQTNECFWYVFKALKTVDVRRSQAVDNNLPPNKRLSLCFLQTWQVCLQCSHQPVRPAQHESYAAHEVRTEGFLNTTTRSVRKQTDSGDDEDSEEPLFQQTCSCLLRVFVAPRSCWWFICVVSMSWRRVRLWWTEMMSWPADTLQTHRYG